jgi:hypothetical protein
LEANAILMNHLWDFPGLLDGAGWFWDLGAKIYFNEKHKIRFSIHFGPPETKNQELMIKNGLVQGWPKNGA